MSRPPVAFCAWTPIDGRSAEIAGALGGEARCFYPLGDRRGAAVVLRYLLSALLMLGYLLRRRPRALIVTNPPVPAGAIAAAWGRVARVPVLLDSHPGGFGLQGDHLSGRLQALHRWAARRATAVLVTVPELVTRVREWGGRAVIVHEAAPAPASAPPPERALGERFKVLFVCVFQRDEPVETVLAAAARLPEAEVLVTGDPERCPPQLRRDAAPNVRFTGFLRGDEYRRAVEDADVVLALTTDPTSVVRAGFEAVFAHRPLVTSDWPALHEAFPHAVHVPDEPRALERGLRSALRSRERLHAAAPAADRLARERWDGQLDELRTLTTTGA